MTDQPRIRVKLKSFDHRVIDEAAKKIIQAALVSGAQVVGPVPLPTKKKVIVVTSSPHTDKDAREQFAILTHKRLDSLQHLDLPAGVGIEIKM
jgi:small subunit ribosomal protein S10